MKNRKQWPLLFVLLTVISCSGLWSMPAIAAVDNRGILRDTPPLDDATGHYEQINGATLSDKTKLDLWHYSGGYWKVTNPGSEAIKVTDDVMGAGEKMVIPANDASFTLSLPAAVKQQIAAGKKVVPVIQSGSGAKLDELFQLPGAFSMDSSTLTFSARPKFNLISTGQLSFDDYGLKIKLTVPFIERKYGYNMYSVFGNGYKAVQVNGWVNPNNAMSTSGMPSGWIHPSMIADTKGTIKSGYQLMINSKLMSSGGFSVGEGTFSNAGALGLCFEYPVKFTFYVYEEGPKVQICKRCGQCELTGGEACASGTCPNWNTPDCGCYEEPDVPPTPARIICQKCHQDELTKEGVCTEESCGKFGTEDCGCFVPPDINGQAILALPSRTYETHPVTAVDKSKFEIDGESFSATRAYAEGYARNSFRIVEDNTGGRVNKDKDTETEAEVMFPHKGSYNVELRVSPKYGGRLTDTKPIEVLKTPTVIASLGGTQKQNRKQVLNIKVATNADNPLRELYAEIRWTTTDPDTGEPVTEKVRLVNHLDGQENTLENTDMIKTRAIIRESSDAYWTNCRLEFLTKNTRTEEFSYYVYARDSRGLWDEAEAEFTVVPDQPPEAVINVAPSFLRGAGTNTAVVSAEDGSTTDGDQLERAWSVASAAGYDGISDVFTSPAALEPFDGAVYTDVTAKPGYQDNSFGTKKSIEFERNGVGKLQLKLLVKDVWTEETLPEYIIEADYLTASAVAVTEVTNVAPMVSLEPINSRTAEILMLAGGEEEYQILKDSVPEITTELLGSAVDPRITVEKMAPAPGSSVTYNAKARAKVNYGFQGAWANFWESGSWAVDDYRLYKAEATWVQGAKVEDDYPNMPFTIYAYDGKQEDEMTPTWSCTITSDLAGTSDRGYSASFAQDNDNKYLYFCLAGRTVIIDKETGAILTTLPYAIGKSNSVYGRSIYTYQTDGIYRISMGDGSVKKVYGFSITPEVVRRIEGEDHFLIKNGTQINRGIFNPRTEGLRMERLLGTESDGGMTTYRLAGIDTAGKMIVSCVTPDNGDPRNGGTVRIRVYDRNNELLKTAAAGVENSNNDYVIPIYDAGGVSHYVGISSNANASKYKRTRVSVWGIFDGYSGTAEAEERKDNGYPAKADQLLMGIEHGDGNVYVMLGGQYDCLHDGSYNSAAQGMAERAVGFCFNVKKGTAAQCPNLGSGVWSGLNNQAEFATRSDSYVAVSTGDNSLYGSASHTTKLVSWGQSIDRILARYFNRGLAGRSDLSAVLILDNTNEAAAKAPADVAALLRSKQVGSFLFASANSGVKYGAEIAGYMGAAGRIFAADQAAEAATTALLKEDGGEADVLQLTTQSEKGAIERSYKLLPGTQYFYEYDYRGLSTDNSAAGDILRLTGNYTRPIPETDLLQDKYVVTASYGEDFNDNETDPFFRLEPGRIRDGQYFGSYGEGKSSSNRFHYDYSGYIKFTVPEGQKAIVSWDYDFLRENGGDWNMGYYVDGRLWKQFLADYKASGHYTHLDLLEPGEHTIGFRSSEYGKSYLFYAKLDNLKVHLVELKSGVALDDGIETSSAVFGDGWKHVEGSFRSPNSVAAYTAVPSAYYNSDMSGWYSTYYEWISKDRGDMEVNFTPYGTCVYYGIQTKSNIGKKAVNYRVGGYSFRAQQQRETRDSADYIPGEFLIPFRNLSGNLKGTVSHSTYNSGVSGDFAGVELAKVTKASSYGLTNANKYILAPTAGGSKAVFVENDAYNGQTTFRFQPGAEGDYQLKDFRIYSIQNGVKVYAEDCTLAESSTVTRWKAEDSQIAVVRTEKPEEDEVKLIYQKGELVAYNVNYFDYENDPSKKQFWRYTHTPFNDGPHPQAAVILDEDGNVAAMPGTVLSRAIDRFYVDGKYTVEHWQEDNTRRGRDAAGNPDYDKASNVASLTFYVQGGGTAPWITHIKTVPGTVKEDDTYKLQIGVDDAEKDELRLITELYFEGKLIYAHKKTGIVIDSSGRYPDVITDTIPIPAQAGKYQVICTVRDWSGAGIGNYKFTVVTEGRITGMVSHTEQWERNRKLYNKNRFGTEFNETSDFKTYRKQKAPRRRGVNVFWSGEEFVLRAAVAGKPEKVTCRILGEPYSVRMTSTGIKNEMEETIYTGSVWKADMMYRWGRPEPEQLTFRFTAHYKGGSEKTCDAAVILDGCEEYWQLHRVY